MLAEKTPAKSNLFATTNFEGPKIVVIVDRWSLLSGPFFKIGPLKWRSL